MRELPQANSLIFSSHTCKMNWRNNKAALKLKRIVKTILYRGNTYTCPLCGNSFRDMRYLGLDIPVLKELQVIGAGRRKKQCPTCCSSDRSRMIYLYLRDYLNISDTKKRWNILHIAPEHELYTALRPMLKNNCGQYVCGDKFEANHFFPDYIEYIDITKIGYNENTFDLIICNHVLEHVPNDLDAMRELRRVLKPGGVAILQVPLSKILKKTVEDPSITDPSERERRFGQYDHCRIYGQDFSSRLEEAGFTFSQINISGEEKYATFALSFDEELFIARK